LALAALLFKNRFSLDEREAAGATAALGISFITEGAIPLRGQGPAAGHPGADDRFRHHRRHLDGGSAVELKVPHGGVFVLPIPNAVVNLGALHDRHRGGNPGDDRRAVFPETTD
jgi:PTS system fructose-specific IIC component